MSEKFYGVFAEMDKVAEMAKSVRSDFEQSLAVKNRQKYWLAPDRPDQ